MILFLTLCIGKWRIAPSGVKTHCLTMVYLNGNKLHQNLVKAPDVPYEDVLEEFDLVWCVEGRTVTHSDLVVS